MITAPARVRPVPLRHATALRDYQRAALEAVRGRLSLAPHRCHLALPTGTGKTRVAAALAAEHLAHGDRVLVLAHRRELVLQLAREFERVCGISAGVVMAGSDDASCQLTVACVSTLARPDRLERLLQAGSLSLVVVDEGHHATAGNTYGAVLGRVSAHHISAVGAHPWVLGLSATPYRLDGEPIEDLLGPCAFTRGLGEMVDAGWLAPLRWEPVRLPELAELRWVSITRSGVGRDFERQGLGAVMRSARAVEATAERTAAAIGPRRSLVFSVNVAHAQELARAYRRRGLAAEAVWGGMPDGDRSAVLDRWRSGDLQVVTNCAVLSEGFDFPELEALVVARPTLSPGLYLQMVGRVTRPVPGKTEALVVDVAGNDLASEARPIELPDFGIGLPRGIEGSHQPRESARDDDAEPEGRRLLWGDPFARSRLSWLRDPVSGLHCAAALGLASFALTPDPADTGLWEAHLHLNEGTRRRAWTPAPPLQLLTYDALPLGQAVVTVDRYVVEHRLGRAVGKRAPWRARPASQKQLDWLARLDPALGREAGAEGWSRGVVSDWLTLVKMRGLVDGLAQESAGVG
jgi:superfamily II DNA or RNA helicase